jgi:hypothetical protein
MKKNRKPAAGGRAVLPLVRQRIAVEVFWDGEDLLAGSKCTRIQRWLNHGWSVLNVGRHVHKPGKPSEQTGEAWWFTKWEPNAAVERTETRKENA